jgi:ABC-type lipoprotein release transport system permease subunit
MSVARRISAPRPWRIIRVSTRDPITFAIVPVLLALMAAAAIPARRAVRVDPVQALREE